MRPNGLFTFLLCLCACGYVSKKQFDEVWDADGDGWGIEEDCDDQNPLIYPYAPDVRGDGCDADCNAEPDADGDDWPDSADCDANDPDIYPCSPNENESDDIDSDCDGWTTIRVDGCNHIENWPSDLGLDPDFEPAPTAMSETEQTIIDASSCGETP